MIGSMVICGNACQILCIMVICDISYMIIVSHNSGNWDIIICYDHIVLLLLDRMWEWDYIFNIEAWFVSEKLVKLGVQVMNIFYHDMLLEGLLQIWSAEKACLIKPLLPRPWVWKSLTWFSIKLRVTSNYFLF